MGTVVFTQFEAEASSPGGTVRLTQFDVFATAPIATVVVTQFEVYGTAASATVVFTQFEALATNTTLQAIVSGPVSGDPAEAVVLSALASTGTPDTYLWTQLSKPTGLPDLVLSGANTSQLSFSCPIVPPDDAHFPNDQPYVYTIRLSISQGATNSTQDYSFTVFPHLMWRWSAIPPYKKEPVLVLLP